MGMNYLGYKLGHPKPLFCEYFITSRCNLKCKHCILASPYYYNEEQKEYYRNLGNDLTTEQSKYAIDQLDRVGIASIGFSGGEPLLRDDLEEIALHAKKKNIYTSLDTNGTLVTKERAKSLSCFDRISVSLDGLKETHEEIRGENTFERAVRGIKYLKKYSHSDIGIIFTISKLNYMEVDEVLDFARDHCDYIHFQPINAIKQLFLDKDNARKVGDKIFKFKKENMDFIQGVPEFIKLFSKFLEGYTAIECNIPCDPFSLYYMLGPSGDLGGCTSLSSHIGNILKEDIIDLHKKGKLRGKKVRDECEGCSLHCTINISLLARQPFYKLFGLTLRKFFG